MPDQTCIADLIAKGLGGDLAHCGCGTCEREAIQAYEREVEEQGQATTPLPVAEWMRREGAA